MRINPQAPVLNVDLSKVDKATADAFRADFINLQRMYAEIAKVINSQDVTLNAELPWQDLVLGTGWTNYDVSTYHKGQIAKDTHGRVYLRGLLLTTAAIATGGVIATLPTGYAPTNVCIFVACMAGPAATRVDANSDGTIRWEGAALTASEWVSLEGLSYSVN